MSIGAATVVKSFSASPHDMAYSSCRSLVYACPVLATPMRAFIHDVSPGLATPAQCVINIVFSPARHYFDTTAPMTNSAPPCARGSSVTPSTPATPTRHRPRHFSHGYLDYGFTTLRSRLPRQRHKGLPPAWEPRWLSLQAQTPRCVDRYDCGGDVHRLRLLILFQSHRLRRYVVTAGGC